MGRDEDKERVGDKDKNKDKVGEEEETSGIERRNQTVRKAERTRKRRRDDEYEEMLVEANRAWEL